MGLKKFVFPRLSLLSLIFLALFLLGGIALANMILGETGDSSAYGHGTFPPAEVEKRAGEEEGEKDWQPLLAREAIARNSLAEINPEELEEEFFEESLEEAPEEAAEREPAPKPGPDPGAKPKSGAGKEPEGPDQPGQKSEPDTGTEPESPGQPEQEPEPVTEPEPGPESDPEGDPPPKPHTVDSAGEARMLELINQERQKAGVPPLSLHKDLRELARLKSLDMYENDYFSHTSETYGSPFDMMRDFGILYRSAGENIAKASSVERAHTNLMNSQGHKNNILNPNFNYGAIGVIRGNCGTYFITQMFIQQ